MSRKTKITLSFLILIIGLVIFLSEYFNSKKIAVYDYMNLLYYNLESSNELEKTDNELDNEDIVLNIDDIDEEENNLEVANNTSYSFNNEDNNYYIGYLIIPDINLKRGFTDKLSKYNTVSKNIEVLSSSDYPDKENGNFIVAAHSGNSSVSYFNKLYLLSNGAKVYVDYKNTTYTYEIVNIYTVSKTGQIEVKRDKNKTSITLITCTKNNNETQTVYIGELINKE